jgi:spore maturation protein B
MSIEISLIILPVFILLIIVYALIKKVDVYDAFIDGAKDGFSLAVKIFPYIIAMMFAVNIFSASGGLDLLKKILDPLLSLFNIPSGVVPLFIMRPFSGSASFGLLASIFNTYGPDSMTGKVASTLMGSSETLFYTISLYFGSVGLKKSGYTIPIVLICDIIGLIVASLVCALFFK